MCSRQIVAESVISIADMELISSVRQVDRNVAAAISVTMESEIATWTRLFLHVCKMQLGVGVWQVLGAFNTCASAHFGQYLAEQSCVIGKTERRGPCNCGYFLYAFISAHDGRRVAISHTSGDALTLSVSHTHARSLKANLGR